MRANFLKLSIIVFLALIFRVSILNLFPPSPNWDEVSLGYNAFSLLKTGRDEWGDSFPTIFRAYGDYKLPVYVYSTVTPVAIFGLTEFAVRLPSVISGTLLVLTGYVLSLKFLSKKFALIVSYLIAISPWSLFTSRIALEASIGLLFVTLGLTLLVYRRFSLGVLFLGLSVWSYNAARVFSPLFLIFYFFLNQKDISKRTIAYCLLPIILLFFPMFWQLFSPTGIARYNWLSLLDKNAVGAIEQRRNLSDLPSPVTRYLYNRPVYFAFRFSSNYIRHFLPGFLFIRGGTHYQFSLPNHGLLYLVSLPFFYLGLIYIFKKPTTYNLHLTTWLLLAAVPGSLVKDAPHTLRAIFMLPPAIIVTTIGLSRIKLPIIFSFIFIVFIFSVYILNFSDYRRDYSWAWQYGYKEAIQYIKERYDQYDEIIITKRYGEPHEFVLFYWPWDPAAYRMDPRLIRYGRSDWFWVDAFAKFRFVNDWDMSDLAKSLDPNKKYLIISSPDNPLSATDLTRINFLDGSPAFLIKEL